MRLLHGRPQLDQRSPLGVWAARTVSRSTAPVTARAALIVFSESAIGTSGTAPVPARTVEDDPHHELGRRRRTRGIVDEDRRLLRHADSGQGGDAGNHRIGPLLAAANHEDALPGIGWQGTGESLDAIGRDHQGHLGHAWHGQQRIQGPTPDRPPPDVDPQLVGAEPPALPSRNQD